MLNRHRGHTLLAANCLMLFFIVGIVPSCSSIYQVVGLYLCAGVCLGLNNGLANTLITWVHVGRNGTQRPKHRARQHADPCRSPNPASAPRHRWTPHSSCAIASVQLVRG